MDYLPKRWERPQSYVGAEWPMHYVFLGQHRDSDSVTRCNFAVAVERLRALPEWVAPSDCPEYDAVSRYVVRESHWAVGWVEWIAIHESDSAALALANEIGAGLDDYPVISDDALSEMEWNEACEWWERMSVRDRLEVIRASRSDASPFAARHAYLPADDSGALLDYLRD